ncbi:unnamed protein product [Effrenium voratum]|nr:unnamed protein product [Effrenium voratum]
MCACCFLLCNCGSSHRPRPNMAPQGFEMSSYSPPVMAAAAPMAPMAPMAQPMAQPMVQPGFAAPVAAAPMAMSGLAVAAAAPMAMQAFAGHPAPQAAKTCANMHGLRRAVNQGQVTCDECDQQQPYGCEIYRCDDACDYDVCMSCYPLTSFVDEAAHGGQSWRMLLQTAPPMVDGSGLLSGPWGDALKAAVLYEMRRAWPSEPRFRGARNGPAGQVIAFLEAKGEALAEHTENVLRENPSLLPH